MPSANRRAALQLLAPPTRPPRPPYFPSRRLPRRPGERREPLALPVLPDEFAAAVKARGLELACAIELCLERALVLRDLADLGLTAAYPKLLAAAAETPIRRALAPAKANYLQMLIAALDHPVTHDGERTRTDAIVDVPLRLFPRVLDVAEAALLGPDELAQALRLEIASTSDGRTMSEWAALAALRLSL